MNKKHTIIFLGTTGFISFALGILLYLLNHGLLGLDAPTAAGTSPLALFSEKAEPNIHCLEKLKDWQGVDSKKICAQFAASFPFAGDSTSIEAADVNAPKMHFDKNTAILLYDSAKAITRDSYCYFIFKKYLGDGSIDPKTFGEVVSGFSILAKEIPLYRAWLKSNLGASCDQKVANAIGTPSSDLEFLNGKSLVALFPLGAFQPGMDVQELKAEVVLTLNHERIHVLENYCQGFESYQEDYFSQADQHEVAELAERFPSYDWNDPVVAAKEYMAFKFERNPTEVENALNCTAQ